MHLTTSVVREVTDGSCFTLLSDEVLIRTLHL
jgi:hypothetical protein